jgi:hypothetical protein
MISNVADALRLLPLVALKVVAAAAGVATPIDVAAAAAKSKRFMIMPLHRPDLGIGTGKSLLIDFVSARQLNENLTTAIGRSCPFWTCPVSGFP